MLEHRVSLSPIYALNVDKMPLAVMSIIFYFFHESFKNKLKIC